MDLGGANNHVTEILLMFLVSMLIWVAKKYMKKLDDHVTKCDRRALTTARQMQWIGDSVHAIADKTGTITAPRPQWISREQFEEEG